LAFDFSLSLDLSLLLCAVFFPFVDLRNHEAARCQVMDLPNFMKVKLMFLNPNSPTAKTALLEVAKEVNSVLNRGGGTIVHCNAGVHRAPQCTAALICGWKSVSYKAAVTWLIVKTWTHQVQTCKPFLEKTWFYSSARATSYS
jgi:hypothetical protein